MSAYDCPECGCVYGVEAHADNCSRRESPTVDDELVASTEWFRRDPVTGNFVRDTPKPQFTNDQLMKMAEEKIADKARLERYREALAAFDIDPDDMRIVGDWLEGERGPAPGGRVKGLWQSCRRGTEARSKALSDSTEGEGAR